jgi:thymidylate synthase (FAD)
MIRADLIDHCGSDLSVVNAARVSFHKESQWAMCVREDGQPCRCVGPDAWDFMSCDHSGGPGCLQERDEKLICYLAKHKHKSPFNHCFASFRVKAPVFVARQLVKHEYLPWNEVSRRYVDDEPEFYFPTFRKRAENKKQGSSDETVDDILVTAAYRTRMTECLATYKLMLERGVAPEIARSVLPQSMMTEWIWSGSLGAFAKMAALRLDSHTQEETRAVAEAISVHMKQLFPVSWEALLEHPIL